MNELESGASPGHKMEWLGPRTAKAFRASRLLDFHRERDSERNREEGSESSTRRLRDRSSSTSTVAFTFRCWKFSFES